jgi:hypothetical protein
VEDVRRIAGQLELTPGYPPKVQMTALAGFIPFKIGDLSPAIRWGEQLASRIVPA